jgi:UDP-2,3-diacylglucosamine pyrophosphatase LpxH
MAKKLKYRTVWISDIHLGTRGSKVKYLEDFLNSFECEKLYLVGDIIDGWQFGRSAAYWPQSHVNIIRKILSKARKETEIYYVIGNYDEFLRKYLDYFEDVHLGNIYLGNEFIHDTVDGRQLLVIHGDLFDGVTRYHKWLSHLGDISYGILLRLNSIFNKVRQTLGMGYWSLSRYLKYKVKSAVSFIDSFEESLEKEARRRGLDGVVCGHIHCAEIKENEVSYYNDGDWVESCTALVEHFDGTIEIVQWHKIGHEDFDNN